MSNSANEHNAAQSITERFQTELKGIQSRYASISGEPSLADNKATLDTLQQQLHTVQASFQATSSSLPSHDQRTLSEAISSLTQTISAARSAAQPRTKFSFKKKPAVVASVPAHEPPTAPTAPTHQQAPPPSTPTPLFPNLHPRPIRRPSATSPLILRHQTAEDIRPLSAPGSSIISHLSSSVLLLPSTESAHISHCTASLLLLSSVHGPVHLTALSNCALVVSTRQFRLHASKDVTVYLACASEPVIEDCTEIRVAPLPAGLDWDAKDSGKWDQVRDFSWLADGANPHWRILQNSEKVGDEVWQGIKDETMGREEILHAFRLDG